MPNITTTHAITYTNNKTRDDISGGGEISARFNLYFSLTSL